MNPSYIVTFSYGPNEIDIVEIYADAKDNKNEAYLRFEELVEFKDKDKVIYTANIAKIESTTEWYGLK